MGSTEGKLEQVKGCLNLSDWWSFTAEVHPPVFDVKIEPPQEASLVLVSGKVIARCPACNSLKEFTVSGRPWGNLMWLECPDCKDPLYFRNQDGHVVTFREFISKEDRSLYYE